MTFSRDVRDELARLRAPRACDARAELIGMARAGGTLHLLPGGARAFEIDAEDPAVVRKAYAALVRVQAASSVEVRLFEPGRGRPKARFVVRAEGDIAAGLIEAGVLDTAERPAEAPRRALTRRCDVSAFLRGAFLVRGSVSDPRAPAHLELRLPNQADAAVVTAMLDRLEVSSSVRDHKAAAVVTIKGTTDAGRLLAAMGAHHSYLDWEEGTVWKSVRGEANRLANCDTANAHRTAVSALVQRSHIESLTSSGTLDHLPRVLQEAASLRLEHPQAPLDELARLSRPPVTKAAMADRFRRLGRHAASLVG
ncbi:MAG: DNA-binding protein WhiA [Actinomycetota bacterium]|nr:DNA-binding protein WhiA [Actinomycetota bacterium]